MLIFYALLIHHYYIILFLFDVYVMCVSVCYLVFYIDLV
jgi:hypothetical protein